MYRCDCDGESHRIVGREINLAIAGARAFFRQVTGERCEGCPWRQFAEPIVADVLELNRMLGPDGAPALLLATDPPAKLWEGLMLYRRVSDLTRAHNEDEDEAQRQARRRLEESRPRG